MFALRRMRLPTSIRSSFAPCGIRVVQQKVGELAALLHQVDAGKSRHAILKVAYAQDIAQHVPESWKLSV